MNNQGQAANIVHAKASPQCEAFCLCRPMWEVILAATPCTLRQAQGERILIMRRPFVRRFALIPRFTQ